MLHSNDATVVGAVAIPVKVNVISSYVVVPPSTTGLLFPSVAESVVIVDVVIYMKDTVLLLKLATYILALTGS